MERIWLHRNSNIRFQTKFDFFFLLLQHLLLHQLLITVISMIYSYIRVSTNTQSIEAQKQEIQRYCDLNQHIIDESIEIEISSIKDNRER